MELQLNIAGLGSGRMATSSRTGSGVKQHSPHLVQWKSETIWQNLRKILSQSDQRGMRVSPHRKREERPDGFLFRLQR